ncbi:MAG TPA: DUF1800 family protein [Opitutaceae bacterium]|nr:DUF1800 family protein [Opitutaceae bacterium]
MHHGHESLGAPTGARPSPADAARFLNQATLGATAAEITRVQELGFEAWIDDQFDREASLSHREAYARRAAGEHFELHHAWWRQILTGQDLLRQRIAYALTQIFVVSEVAIEFAPWEMLEYYDDLARLAFGNWRDLLRWISVDPLMGFYLSHLRNRKPDPALQRFPDENYAREVMQLFSIGLWELNDDGSHKLDAEGREIPTYDNEVVTAFARVFTGFGFGDPSASVTRPADFLESAMNFSVPMALWEHEHDRGEKRLLRGIRLPALDDAPGRTGLDDLEDAVDNLFLHPNVGPFFGRLLIQRLVTSNPSPGYIRRVAGAFQNNGRAVRGDMRAVIKAVLLDPEARTCSDARDAGRLREPYLRYINLARAFQARADAGTFKVNDHDTFEALNQILLHSPSVFNFYLPDYQPPGVMAEAGCYGPEFQIMTSSTAITALNHYMKTVASGFGDAAGGPEAMRLDLSAEIALADDPARLIDHLDVKMTGGALGPDTKRILLTAWREMPATDSPEQKVKSLMQLVTISPDFAVTP